MTRSSASDIGTTSGQLSVTVIGPAKRRGGRPAREVKPPFSPEAVTGEFAETLKRYRVTKVFGDRYGGEFPRELFRKHGINYSPSEKPKSDLYRDVLPLINSRACDPLFVEGLRWALTSTTAHASASWPGLPATTASEKSGVREPRARRFAPLQ
jgi:hypothetical protein